MIILNVYHLRDQFEKKCPIVVFTIDLQTHPDETMRIYMRQSELSMYEATMTKWKSCMQLKMGTLRKYYPPVSYPHIDHIS